MDAMVGETSLHVWDIHVEDAYQRKGLGKHLLTLMELIARRYCAVLTLYFLHDLKDLVERILNFHFV